MMATTAGRAKIALTGPQKSAVLCIALGPKGAARILQQLSPDEVERVSREIAAMETVDTELVQTVLDEFQSAAKDASTAPRGGVDYAHTVHEQALGSGRAHEVVGKIQSEIQDSGFARLRHATPSALAGLLREEHPQTIALVLAHIEEGHAAGVLAALDPTLAADVAYRVARLSPVTPEILAIVENALGGLTAALPPRSGPARGGPDTVGRWLNLAGADLEKQVLESIQERSSDVAGAIRSSMFTFEDLLLVDGKGIQRLLREIETKELALALKAASDELKKHIKANMSERAGEALDEEIEMLGPVRVRDVEAVHARIIESVRALEQAGEILIRGRGGDDGIIA
jgi:flagellar motor switch protein FliG